MYLPVFTCKHTNISYKINVLRDLILIYWKNFQMIYE